MWGEPMFKRKKSINYVTVWQYSVGDMRVDLLMTLAADWYLFVFAEQKY